MEKEVFTIDSSKERWLKKGLNKLSISDLDLFFRFAADAVEYPIFRDKRCGLSGHKYSVKLIVNRIKPTFEYSLEKTIASSSSSLANEMSILDCEWWFFKMKACLLCFIEKGKRKQKNLLKTWFRYEPWMKNFRKAYPHDIAFGRIDNKKRLKTEFCDNCGSAYREARRIVKKLKETRYYG